VDLRIFVTILGRCGAVRWGRGGDGERGGWEGGGVPCFAYVSRGFRLSLRLFLLGVSHVVLLIAFDVLTFVFESSCCVDIVEQVCCELRVA